jgi:hypothetical protein
MRKISVILIGVQKDIDGKELLLVDKAGTEFSMVFNHEKHRIAVTSIGKCPLSKKVMINFISTNPNIHGNTRYYNSKIHRILRKGRAPKWTCSILKEK